MEHIHKTLDSVIQDLRQDKSEKINKLTGFLNIDYALNQTAKDSLITIVARPAMGKTSFILNIISNFRISNSTSYYKKILKEGKFPVHKINNDLR